MRAIGGIFPAVAFAGTIVAWRRIGWRNAGEWWGLPVAVLAMAFATLFSSDSLITFLFHRPVRLLHPGMAALLYGVGVTLLFGGPLLVRRAIAPLCLLLIVNPVPEAFQNFVDMPLQILSASTARAFAHLIGLEPTGDQLRMMFAPSFGMMIVPGCNGLRGAITLGYLALIYGYVRRLSPRAHALLTVGGVLLGYLLNLARLCLLVCYYRLGLTVTSIQSYGTQIDYVIGVSLFLSATVLLGWTAGVYFQKDQGAKPDTFDVPAASDVTSWKSPRLTYRMIALVVAAIVFFIPQARSFAAHYRPPVTDQQVAAAMPQLAGGFTRVKTWNESDSNGNVKFVWGEYHHRETGAILTLGVFVHGEDHLVSTSKRMQGVYPAWSGSLDIPRPGAAAAHFLTSFYRDSATRTMDAETSCHGNVCELNTEQLGGPLSVIAPHLTDLFIDPGERRLPLVVREQWAITQAADPNVDDLLRQTFNSNAAEFFAALDLRQLVALEQ